MGTLNGLCAKLSFRGYPRDPVTILHFLTGKIFAVAVVLAVLCGTASAGIISAVQMFGTQAGTGPGMGTVSVPVIFSPNPSNDNQIGGGDLDNNLVVPIKRFDNPGYIDIVFQVTPSASNNIATEYKFFESVDNNTLTNWSSYEMELGFGFGANFDPSALGDGLDFDAPLYDPLPVSSAFANVVTSKDMLVFSNGTQGTGSETYQFRIDVPNLPDDNTSFTLRQIPIPVPEPSVLIMLVLGALGLGIWRRKK